MRKVHDSEYEKYGGKKERGEREMNVITSRFYSVPVGGAPDLDKKLLPELSIYKVLLERRR